MSESKRVVLLVDNDESALTLYGDMLAEYEYEVLIARDGHEALSLFKEKSPPVVVTDVHMPEMNGEELFNEIMALNKETKVIFITGWSDVSAATRLVKSGAFDYLDKPVSLVHLVGVIKNAFLACDGGQREVDSPSASSPNLQPVYVADVKDSPIPALSSLQEVVNGAVAQAQSLVAHGHLDEKQKNKVNCALECLRKAQAELGSLLD